MEKNSDFCKINVEDKHVLLRNHSSSDAECREMAQSQHSSFWNDWLHENKRVVDVITVGFKIRKIIYQGVKMIKSRQVRNVINELLGDA